MIIKLKNAVKEYEGKIFLLNSDAIISVYEAKDEEGVDSIFIFVEYSVGAVSTSIK